VSAPTTVCYRFGQFELQPDERRLLAAGTPVALAPRAFNLLVALVELEGHLATKKHLLERVWPGVIVEENALQAQVSTLRKVLGADAIATVSGAGYRLVLGLVRSEQAPMSAQDAAPRHNLVRQLTSFIGREQQIGELKELLQHTQLLTLSGAGGCGKTRLATELATQVSDDYADGVWLVELAALADGQLVPQTVAGVLALEEGAGESFTQTLERHLAPRQVLLVLDNAEHLLAACADLVRSLLQRCARLTVLVTSREQLKVPGELTYRVPSLSVPDPDRSQVAEMLLEYESARLFIERARLQHAHFAVTEQSVPAIASICAHLDGIPLAIELAAARIRALSVAELNQRLDQRFRLLTDSSRTALPRHRTLGTLIDWSYGLLNEAERAVFCRASVFAGGFALEAAERVLSDDLASETEMLDLLTSLTDKSLLQAEEHEGTTRYRQLETVRQYGRDRLRESVEETRWERRHLDYFLALAEAAEEGLRGGDRHAWLKRLEPEHENMRTALEFALESEEDHLAGLRLAGALFPFWLYTTIYWNEGRAWLSRFLDSATGAADLVRAKALNAAGTLADCQGDLRAARASLEESVAIRRRLRDRRGLAAALINLGNLFDSAGDPTAARGLLEESLAIMREIGNRLGIQRALMSFSSLLCGVGETRLARSLAQESIDIARGEGELLASGLYALAAVELKDGDAEAAATLCRDALAAKTVDRYIARMLLEAAACAESELGEPVRAALVWGHLERLEREIRGSQARRDRLRHERSVAAARAKLSDEAAFSAAWRRGAALTTEQAIALVLRPSETET
jgi:non-specific serine/threonine protein kinase